MTEIDPEKRIDGLLAQLKKPRLDLLRRSRETLTFASPPGTPISQLSQALKTIAPFWIVAIDMIWFLQ